MKMSTHQCVNSSEIQVNILNIVLSGCRYIFEEYSYIHVVATKFICWIVQYVQKIQ